MNTETSETAPVVKGGWISAAEAFSDAVAPQKADNKYVRTDEIKTYKFRLRADDPVERVSRDKYEGRFPPQNRAGWDILHCVDADGKDLIIDCKSAALFHVFNTAWKELGLSKSSADPIPQTEVPLIEWELEVVIPSNPTLKKSATLKLTATRPAGQTKTWAV